MNDTWSELMSVQSWRGLGDIQRREVARRLAEALGDGFSVADELRGRESLAAVQHEPTATRFVAIPGGTFQMGVRAEEEAAVIALAPEARRDAVARELACAQPAHVVAVTPFLCAIAPLLDPGIDDIFEDWDDDITRPGFDDENAPIHLTRGEAARVCVTHGFRLLSEAEWEYVAREGGSASWIGPPITSHEAMKAIGAKVLYHHASFEPAGSPLETSNSFGLWGLLWGDWVADSWHEGYIGAPSDSAPWQPGAEPEVIRAYGAATGWPWQDSAAFVACHAAARTRGSEPTIVAGVRWGRDLP